MNHAAMGTMSSGGKEFSLKVLLTLENPVGIEL